MPEKQPPNLTPQERATLQRMQTVGDGMIPPPPDDFRDDAAAIQRANERAIDQLTVPAGHGTPRVPRHIAKLAYETVHTGIRDDQAEAYAISVAASALKTGEVQAGLHALADGHNPFDAGQRRTQRYADAREAADNMLGRLGITASNSDLETIVAAAVVANRQDRGR